MAKSGETILDVHGYGLIFRLTAADTGGELLEMDAFYRPQGKIPPQHFHPSQEEHFQVVSGEFHVVRGSQHLTFQAGQSFSIPARVAHAMHNVSAEKGHLIWQTRPALKSEDFYAAAWGLDYGERRPAGLERLLRLAVIFQTHRQEVRLTSGVLRAVMAALAPPGRLFGYRAV